MTVKKSFLAILVGLALSTALVSLADAEQPPATPAPAPTRAKAKARPRFVNPYDVQRTRLKINQFGFFTSLPSDSLSESSADSALKSSLPTSQVISTPSVQPVSTAVSIDTAT